MKNDSDVRNIKTSYKMYKRHFMDRSSKAVETAEAEYGVSSEFIYSADNNNNKVKGTLVIASSNGRRFV